MGRLLNLVLDRPLRITVVSSITFLIIFLVKFLIDVKISALHLNRIAESTVDALLAASLATTIEVMVLRMSRDRREQVKVEMFRIAELNHHVRNALQVIISKEQMRKQPAIEVLESCNRIQQALRRLYPVMGIERREKFRVAGVDQR